MRGQGGEIKMNIYVSCLQEAYGLIKEMNRVHTQVKYKTELQQTFVFMELFSVAFGEIKC